MSDLMYNAILRHCKKYKYSKEYTDFWIVHPFCQICGNYSDAPHHIRTRGVGGSDGSENLLALCITHHLEAHDLGVQSFARKYSQYYEKLFAGMDTEEMGSLK